MSPTYRYLAADAGGRKQKGRLYAAGPKELLEALEALGLTAVTIREARGPLQPGSPPARRLEQLLYGKAGSRDFMFFCRQFAVMTGAGLSALHALQSLAGQMEQPAFRRRLEQVSATLAKGSSLSEAFRSQDGFFPLILLHMVEAGEAGGALDTVLERLAEHFERRHDLEEKIRSAALYPLFITGVAVLVMAVMILFVLPQFASVFNSMGLQMPLFASVLLQGGVLLRRHWLPITGLLLLALFLLRRLAATEKGRFRLDLLKLELPLFGKLYRRILTARFARMMGVLTGSGLSLITSLALVDRMLDNRALSRTLTRTREAVSRGEPLAGPLKEAGFFPPLLVEMVRIGELSGALEEMFGRSADFYEREVSFTVSRLGAMLEPVLLLFVGIFVGALVFSILSPMYQVFQMI